MSKKKVVIIAGGGAFGIIPAYFFSILNKSRPFDKVDCLSGCSIGGILALAYASGNDPSYIYKTFQEKMDDCFIRRFISYVYPLACPTYENDGLDTVLEDIFSNDTMECIRNYYPNLDVFIPALNLTKNSYKVFDNIYFQDKDVKLKDIAGFTSCAPTYYSGREFNGDCFLDGGLIEVAPLLTTITGLSAKRNVNFSDMDVLMLGCGHRTDSAEYTTSEYNSFNLLQVATNVIAPYTTMSNEMATLYWGKNLGLNSFTYFNPVPIKGDMADINEMNLALENAKNYYKEFVITWEDFISKE